MTTETGGSSVHTSKQENMAVDVDEKLEKTVLIPEDPLSSTGDASQDGETTNGD